MQHRAMAETIILNLKNNVYLPACRTRLIIIIKYMPTAFFFVIIYIERFLSNCAVVFEICIDRESKTSISLNKAKTYLAVYTNIVHVNIESLYMRIHGSQLIFYLFF